MKFVAFILMTVASFATYAEPYLIFGSGITQYNARMPDGDTLCERGFPCVTHTNPKLFEIGAGLKLNKWLGLNWATELYYGNYGTTTLQSKFVPDADYDFSTRRCISNCGPANQITVNAHWRYQGFILAARPSYNFGDFAVYGKLGLGLLFVTGKVYATAPGGSVFTDISKTITSAGTDVTRYGLISGAGLSYTHYKHFQPFLEFNHVQTFGSGCCQPNSFEAYKIGARIPF